MLVRGDAAQASIPVGMEKSGPSPKPAGKSLTWREPGTVCTGNNPRRISAAGNMWGPLEKVQILHIFLLFVQKPTAEG